MIGGKKRYVVTTGVIKEEIWEPEEGCLFKVMEYLWGKSIEEGTENIKYVIIEDNLLGTVVGLVPEHIKEAIEAVDEAQYMAAQSCMGVHKKWKQWLNKDASSWDDYDDRNKDFEEEVSRFHRTRYKA